MQASHGKGESSGTQAIFPSQTHFTKARPLGILIVVFLLIKILSLLFLPNRQLSLASDLSADNISNAVNRERSLRNLLTLNQNGKLQQAAQSKSDDMIARKYFAHVDPDGHYIWDKIVANGYTPYLQLGENLAIEFYDTDSLMAAWMNSPTHRANILQEGFRDQGMGLAFGSSQAGQYHSSIANTFGTLALAAKIPKPEVAASQNRPPVKAPVKTSKPKTRTKTVKKPITLGSEQTAAAAPSLTASPSPANTLPPPDAKTPLEIRGGESLALNTEKDFALPSRNEATSSSQSPNPAGVPLNNNLSAQTVIGNDKTTTLTDYQINRYLILICGVALFLLMISDIKMAIEKKFSGLDKKANNLALLLISLIVVAFLYWL